MLLITIIVLAVFGVAGYFAYKNFKVDVKVTPKDGTTP